MRGVELNFPDQRRSQKTCHDGGVRRKGWWEQKRKMLASAYSESLEHAGAAGISGGMVRLDWATRHGRGAGCGKRKRWSARGVEGVFRGFQTPLDSLGEFHSPYSQNLYT